MRPKLFVHCLQAALFATTASTFSVFALPEDAQQPLVVETPDGNAEMLLNAGLVIYRGTANSPVKVTQGSLLITGTEIRLQSNQDGALQSVSATGNPARFQQQPAANQAIVHISGNQIHFDNVAQTLTIDAAAEFSQGASNMRANHIDYDIKTRHINATSQPGSTPVNTVIPVKPATP
jgi:lipopolysaccharide export system protein LptA